MIEIIPAIDLVDGRCVRLTEGDFARKKVYDQSPLDMARAVEAAGLKRLHMVDLDGARRGKVVNQHTLQAVCACTSLAVDFGGGIASDEDAGSVFECGASQLVCGSVAVKNRALFENWLRNFGAERVILAADVKDGRIAMSGWLAVSDMGLEDFLLGYAAAGIRHVLCTDIRRDGALTGPAFDLYRSVVAEFPGIKLIASGGVNSLDDIRRLNDIGVHGVVIGKALYEGRLSLAELAELSC